jgi:hypothetical protein
MQSEMLILERDNNEQSVRGNPVFGKADFFSSQLRRVRDASVWHFG